MDTTTSEMVERLYASGKVERPMRTAIGGFLAMHLDDGEWLWCWTHYDDPLEFSEEVATDDATARIGWSLVRACWAKGWTVPPPHGAFSGHKFVDVLDQDGTKLASSLCPIRAMVEALGGGE